MNRFAVDPNDRHESWNEVMNFAFKGIEKAFTMMQTKEDGMIKPLISFNESSDNRPGGIHDLLGVPGLIPGPVALTITTVLLEIWPTQNVHSTTVSTDAQAISRFENEGGAVASRE